MTYRGTTIVGSVLAAVLGCGIGLRTVARAAGVSERELGRQVRRGSRARLREAGDLELLEGMLCLHALGCAVSARFRAPEARLVAWSSLDSLEALGWSVEPLASVVRPLRTTPPL